MTDEEFQKRYEHLRPFFNKIDDADPCEIISIDMSADPAIVRMRCDNDTIIDLTVSVKHEPK